MGFTDYTDNLQSSAMVTMTTHTSEEVLAAELSRIKEATSNASELHMLQVEHAKQMLLQVKESVIHARERHSLEMKQMNELHLLKIRKLKLELKRINSRKAN